MFLRNLPDRGGISYFSYCCALAYVLAIMVMDMSRGSTTAEGRFAVNLS